MSTEDKLAHRWRTEPALRAEFGDSFASFSHFERAAASGRARIIRAHAMTAEGIEEVQRVQAAIVTADGRLFGLVLDVVDAQGWLDQFADALELSARSLPDAPHAVYFATILRAACALARTMADQPRRTVN